MSRPIFSIIINFKANIWMSPCRWPLKGLRPWRERLFPAPRCCFNCHCHSDTKRQTWSPTLNLEACFSASGNIVPDITSVGRRLRVPELLSCSLSKYPKSVSHTAGVELILGFFFPFLASFWYSIFFTSVRCELSVKVDVSESCFILWCDTKGLQNCETG